MQMPCRTVACRTARNRRIFDMWEGCEAEGNVVFPRECQGIEIEIGRSGRGDGIDLCGREIRYERILQSIESID